MVQLVFVLAFGCTAISITSKALPESSVCHSDAVTDTLFSDETSFLQKFKHLKRQSGIEAQTSPATEKPNIVYVRIAKTGSTTTAGVLRKLASNNNISGATAGRVWPSEGGEPGLWAAHGALSQSDFGANPTLEPVAWDDNLPSWRAVQDLKKKTPFLMTVIRDPASRAMSKWYWNKDLSMVPLLGKKTWLTRFNNQQFRYIRMSAESTMDEVFDAYDLIGLTERLDDSLVVLAAMLNVPLSDVLYMSSKNSSAGFVSPTGNVSHSAHPSLSEEPDDVQEILHGTFAQKNNLDYELYQRANDTLNAKIKEMHLESAIATFKTFLARAQEACEAPGTDKDAVQQLTKCYYHDEGCNYECFNTKFNAIGRDMCEWCDGPTR